MSLVSCPDRQDFGAGITDLLGPTHDAAFQLKYQARNLIKASTKRDPHAVQRIRDFHQRFKQAADAISIICRAVTSVAVKVESRSGILTFGVLALSASGE